MKEENKNDIDENNKEVYLSERNIYTRRNLEINLDKICVGNLSNKPIAYFSSKNKTSNKINFADFQNNNQILSNEDYNKKEKDDEKKKSKEEEVNGIFPSQRSNCPIVNNFKRSSKPQLEIQINPIQVFLMCYFRTIITMIIMIFLVTKIM